MSNNIFLISLDTLRFDCVGYQPDKSRLHQSGVTRFLKTPTLDRIAEQSLCFTHAVSTNTYTTAAHASIFTGLYPPRHGVREFYGKRLNSDVYTLAEMLEVYGYRTTLFTDHIHIFDMADLGRGFQTVIAKDDGELRTLLKERRNSGDGKNLFVIHLFDIHVPYLASENDLYNDGFFLTAVEEIYKQGGLPFDRTLYAERDKYFVWQNFMQQAGRKASLLLPLYVQGVSRFDSGRLKAFFSMLRELNYLDDSMICIFSDHGEGRASDEDREDFGHSGPLFDEVIRVPLMLRHPDIRPGTSDKLVSLVDIFPTILEFATGSSPHDLLPYACDGVSLLKRGDERAVYAETWLDDHQNEHWNLDMASYLLYQRALRTRTHKYVIYGTPENFEEQGFTLKSDEEFLREYYRSVLCTFESYDEYMKDLAELRGKNASRESFLAARKKGQYCYFDLQKDPLELNPIFPGDALQSPHGEFFKAIIAVGSNTHGGSRSVEELDQRFIGNLAERLVLALHHDTLSALIHNKHLLNEFVNKVVLDKALSDEEFLTRVHEVFLGKPPGEKELREGMDLLRKGVTRRLYFNRKVFNNQKFAALRTSALRKEPQGNIMALEEYRRKYQEIAGCLTFRVLSKIFRFMDNRVFPPETKRGSLYTFMLEKLRKRYA